MRKLLFVLTVLLIFPVLMGITYAAGKKANQTSTASNILYVCNCGPECKCNTVSTKPGKCTCGNELVPMHVLKIENDKALLCTCGKDCTCKIDPKDPTKCGCGKPVKEIGIKGMYVCNCGTGCMCNTVSDKPGKCTCGTDLKKVE